MGFEIFDKDIKMGLQAVYIFYGTEKYLIEQYISKMIDKYVPETYRDFNLTYFDGEKTSVDEVLDACETMPFFSDQKVIIVKNAPYFKSKKSGIKDAEEQRMISYFESPSSTCKLFFLSSGNVDKRKKSTKAVVKNGRLVEFDKLAPNVFPKWVFRKISQHGKTIDERTMNYLIERLAYLDKHSSKGLLDVDNELKMICSAAQDRDHIEQDDIDPFVKKPLDADIFMLVDAVGQKRAETAIKLMHELLRHGEPIQIIFTMITRQFRLLKKIKMLVKEGYNQGSIAKLIGLHPYVVKNIMRQIHLFDDLHLTAVLEKCSAIDYKMKSTSIDPVLAIETLIIECSIL